MPGKIEAQAGIGITYGLYEFNIEGTQRFINWLQSIGHAYGAILSYAPGSCEFSAVWKELAEMDSEEFSKLQMEFRKHILNNRR